jgi:hypothetical protein
MANSPGKSPLATHALRGYGPRVFISYSFADSGIAKPLESSLRAKGFQVQREDDTSLINQKLTEAIPRRVADAEVFIQLLTTTANRSAWVERELDWMFKQRDAGTGVIFLPIVFDKYTLSDRLKEWWYLDLSRGLTPEAMEAIERLCLKSVHLADDPFSVVDSDLEEVLRDAPQDGRRIILDSDGKLLAWAHDTIAFAEGIESEHRDSLLAQEKSRLDRLVTRLKIRDEVVRKLAIEVMREMKTYTNEPLKDARKPLHHFLRVVLADLIIAAYQVAPPDPHTLGTVLKDCLEASLSAETLRALESVLMKMVKDRIEAARSAESENYSQGYLNPGLYAWAFGEKGGEESLVEMDIIAPDHRYVKLLMPRRVFGDMADIYTRSAITFDPRSELLSGTFINYVLPQIAIRAAYNLTNPATVRSDLEGEYAWTLEQHKMGLS